jgi:hypothetical protein
MCIERQLYLLYQGDVFVVDIVLQFKLCSYTAQRTVNIYVEISVLARRKMEPTDFL